MPRTDAPDPPSAGRVALFADRFLPYSQTFIYEEIRAHERYAVDVFCKERRNADRFPYERVVHPTTWLGQRIYENVGYWPRFDRMLGRGDYDLLHAHFGTTAVYALPYVLRHDLPFVVTFWGNDVSVLLGTQRYNPKNWRYLALRQTIMDRADRMLCVSRELAAFVREMSGRPEAIEVWSHGVDLDRFRPVEHENEVPSVVMVGRFTEKKGHVYALRAFANTLGAGHAAHLTLIGDGAREGRCRALVRDLGIGDRVTFAGVRPPAEVAGRLARADVALVPSVVARNHDREGSPTVAKEAGACGVPVVATCHAGLPEIVDDGETGLLVPERNVEALTDALGRLLDDAALRRRLGQAAREKMEREFELHAQVRTLERHYDQIRRDRPAGPR
ncbi:MAG: glycosyltransferase [Salinibacter sp.]|uniref:glycosyltransferase n=1 Tax=Salinibacter sp. TaxID=2065818 RepID=UPI002FC32BBC